MKKLVFALIVVAALLVVAMPVAAQGPKPWFVRAVGTNEDPFGGLPLYGSEKPWNMNSIIQLGVGGDVAMPGGLPSDKSGDGTSPRKAIYIGGAWANQQPAKGFGIGAGEHPTEIASCVTVKIPAGASRWFKMDTWKWAPIAGSAQGYPIELQVWLDDELDGATKPSGSSVWGAADDYMVGTQAWDGWQKNADSNYGVTAYKSTGGPHVEGYVMQMYPPEMLMPNFAFKAPNAWLFTVNAGSTGSISRSGPYPPEGGVSNSINCQQNVNSAVPGVLMNKCVGNVGFGSFNMSQPSHLLWYATRSEGWWFARVINQMIWDGTSSVCSYRSVQTK